MIDIIVLGKGAADVSCLMRGGHTNNEINISVLVNRPVRVRIINLMDEWISALRFDGTSARPDANQEDR